MTGDFSKRAYLALAAISASFGPAIASAEEAAITLAPVNVEGQRPDEASRDSYVAPAAPSGSKSDTPVLETPQAITTVTRKQLDDQNAQSVKEALYYTSGILTTADTTNRYDSFFLRGFGGFGLDTRVVDVLDGLKLPRGQGFALPAIDPFLLDRIEVLKGPSAVLYGQSSPGGLVNEVSRAPSNSPYHELRVEGGSNGRFQTGITSQDALDAEGHWQYNITAIGRTAGTNYDGVEEQRVAVSPAVTWTPNGKTTFTLRGFYQYDPEGGYFNSLYDRYLAPASYRRALNRDLNVGDPSYDSYDRKQYGIGYSFDHRFNETVSISSQTRYFAIDLDFQSLQMAAAITDDGLLPRIAVHSLENVHGVASDHHAQFDFATGALKHKLLTGIDIQHSASDWEYRYGAAPSLDVLNPQYGVAIGALTTIINSGETLNQTGLYAQDQLSFGGLQTLLGLRYDWTDQKSDNHLSSTITKQSDQAPSYRVGLLYKFDNGLAPYASYSTSFEPTSGVDINSNPFKPTTAQQWEVGVKYEPSVIKALFTLSGFDIRQQNVLTPDSTTGFNVQQGEVHSQGVEFEARGQATANLELIAALTVLKTEITESSASATIGKRPQAAPNYYGSLWANYSFTSGLLDGLSLGSGLRVVGSSFADDANTIKADGYVLVDAALRYDLAKISPSLAGTQVTLNATNLLDKTYYSSCSSNFYCQYGEGAQVLAGVRYQW